MTHLNQSELIQLSHDIKKWAIELGFQQAGICDINLHEHEQYLNNWLDANYHGEMEWMARHGLMRARPDELLPGTIRVISVRMNYLPPDAQFAQNLSNPNQAYISRYALGRDYHKLMRNRLNQLGKKIQQRASSLGFRPFVDSAPLLERPLAAKAGIAWNGKHSLSINKDAGSWFFLGELLINLPLPIDKPLENSCGQCHACIQSCPTNAIVADGIVDARRCISYLTIEFDGIIPEEFRKLIGNRVYGCDDCQLVCPWNRYATPTKEKDFYRKGIFEDSDLIHLFRWTEDEFLTKMQGSAIRRIGHLKWLRNLSIAMGNAPKHPQIILALKERLGENELLDVHIQWALVQQNSILSKPQQKQQRLIRVIEKGLPRDA